MAVVSSSLALHLLPLLLLLVTNEATTFYISNQCSYTVWPAAVPVGGGMQLDPGKAWTIDVLAATNTMRLWARTGCSFDSNGTGSCQTGDCGGVLVCTRRGQPPNTVAEILLGQFNNEDVLDISLVDGFNMPMDFLPVPVKGGPWCSKGPRCQANITSQCPSKQKVPGGCNKACTVNRPRNCQPTTYSGFFKRMCPDAYSYPKDDFLSTFTCPIGTDYKVIFCPPITQTISLAAASPLPTPQVEITHLSPSPLPGPNGIRFLISIILGSTILATVIFLTLFSMLVLATCFLCKCFIRKQSAQGLQEVDEEEEFEDLQGTPMRFTFQQLKVATNQFTDKLGEGGFGSVFRGHIGVEIIAVKCLDRTGQGEREFLAEVQTIGSIHHFNLVRLIGFCAEKSHRFLVYEYMPKRSLDRWIYHRGDGDVPPLDWRMRCKIVTQIAKGLSYLHEECAKIIAHFDVKPQNILLDDNFNAKLSDFGLCKLIDRDKSQVMTRMRGTPGYLAPDWLTSQVTEKADVYSFGVVVMEIISGRKNLDTSRSEESIHLITLLEEKVKSDNLVDLIDKHSNDMQVHKQEVIQMMKLAMWCLQIDCKRRPKMSEVVEVLEGTMNAETNIDNNFVASSPAIFDIAANESSSALASEVSGPR